MLYSSSLVHTNEESDCDFFDTDFLNVSPHSSDTNNSVSSAAAGADDGALNDGCADEINDDSDDEADCSSVYLRDSEGECDEGTSQRLKRLALMAQSLCHRFNSFASSHADIPGLGKLRTRYERELELAVEAVEHEGAATHQGPSPTMATRPSYLTCNCLSLLELLTVVLENEPDIVSVMHPLSPAVLRKTALRPSADILPNASFEVDVVSCGGKRWVKVKGTSRKNMPLELTSNASTSERRAFTHVLLNIKKGAECVRLPFREKPQLCVLLYYRPTRQLMAELCDAVGGNYVQCLAAGESSSNDVLATSGNRQQRNIEFYVFEDLIQMSLSQRTLPLSWNSAPLQDRESIAKQLWSRTCPPLEQKYDFINFDVTALVSLCSDTCNGFSGAVIPLHPVLDEQSRMEAKDPAVDNYIEPCLRVFTCMMSLDAMRQTLQHRICGAPPTKDEVRDGGSSQQWACASGVTHEEALEDLVLPIRGFPLNDEQLEKLQFSHPSSALAGKWGDSFADDTVSTAIGAELDSNLQLSSSTVRSMYRGMQKEMNEGDNFRTSKALRPNWIVADSALDEFMWIIGTIAGPAEYRRAVALLRCMSVVSTRSLAEHYRLVEGRRGGEGCYYSTSPSPSMTSSMELSQILMLEETGKISGRHKAVFGLGDVVRGVTISANKQFAQAARDQGVDVAVVHHPSRALTERKRNGGDRMDGPRKPPTVRYHFA